MMTKNIPAFIARTQFGQILERVSKDNERFVVTKKGEAAAVILGIDDFLATIADAPESLRLLQRQAGAAGASSLTLEQIEEEIAAVRKSRARH
jgi:prevent-host-death family protein